MRASSSTFELGGSLLGFGSLFSIFVSTLFAFAFSLSFSSLCFLLFASLLSFSSLLLLVMRLLLFVLASSLQNYRKSKTSLIKKVIFESVFILHRIARQL